jgi:hypothetical protein
LWPVPAPLCTLPGIDKEKGNFLVNKNVSKLTYPVKKLMIEIQMQMGSDQVK